jgi:hypothetical protein
MKTLSAALAQRDPSEVAFAATVSSRPHFFFGSNTHALHERFRVHSDDGHSLEIVDNVKLAPSVPVAPGDRVFVQGELVPQAARGPIVHWTHHDPRHRHVGGFIDFAGRRYA